MDRKQKKRKAPIIEALEPRILFSADLFGGATDNPGADDSLATLLDDTATVLEKQTDQLLKDQTDTALYELPAEDDDVSLAPAKDAIRTELVFVDTDTPDYQQLVDDMLSGSDENRRLEVILLDNNSDGIEQITSALQDYQGIDAVHLISHGEDGVVDLGNTQLNNQTLATYQAQLQSWAAHLNADADILFYGCDLAASEDGQILINRIASFTGADIAASEDLTGNAELGGDWELEYNAGQIEAQIALSEQVQVTWQGSLSQSLWLSTDSNVTSSGANGLDSWTEGQVLEFSGASLAHGDTTAGDLSMVIDFDTFTSNSVDAGGLHFVSHDMTVGGANGTFDLKAGDVLVSFLQDETILAAHSSTNADMPVQDQDLLVFRPDAFNDYSAGTFTVLLDDVVADDLKGFTLIEQDTTIGGTDVAAGSFLLIAETSATTSIDLFVPTGVGEATTTGTTTPLIDISQLGIDPDRLRGIEVIEAATTIGGQSLAKGDILATLNVDDNVSGVGSNNLPVDKNDVFVLSLTATGMGTTAGSATMFLDGSDVGLDDNPSAESPYALALHNYSQLTVDTTSDVADGDTSSIEALLLDKGADGKISLREAIEAANATPNGDIADTIRFNITDALVGNAHTISVGSALPSITDTLMMDGTSEPDFSGTPVIRIDGSGAGSNADGLDFTSTSDNSTVRGFMITGFDRDGIYVDSGADYLTFTGNWIGTTGAGSTGVGNGDDGIDLRGSNATIGGTGANEGNVITNSGDEGLQIFGTGVTAHLVQGNVIGLDPDGESGSGNNDVGLSILSGSGNIVGGTTASARNVISNNFEGIEINSSNNVFQGNYIGTDASGTLDRGNRSDDGIEIKSGATGNLIGGTETGAGNLIAFNARDGVNIVDGSGNTVLGNQIHSNSDLGIDLDTGGVTSNDSNDGDTGANNLQNYPTITTADLNGSNLTLSGTLDTDGVSTSYRIEFFGNAAGTQDATNGEGRFFLASTTVTTDVNGDASFNDVLLSGITLSDGDYVSATATRIDDAGQVGIDDQLAYGDTSEFAVNIAITAVNDAPELSGANDLNPINEDEVDNAGTLVSDIIAGQISDADSNSVEGIAVTAVDDTNGTWQYTTDGGTNWVAFGAVDSSNARLLAADADTSVRFVPDANWNGTVTNGITLHAWDRTSGTNGSTTDLTATITETVQDDFGTSSYQNNDGSYLWNSGWQELGESDGPSAGEVQVTGSPAALQIGGQEMITERGLLREVDLSQATSATLTLDASSSEPRNEAFVTLAISTDGGSNWTDLQTWEFSSLTSTPSPQTFDISAFASANTQIRFLGSGEADAAYFYADNVQITFDVPATGGSTAFSTDTHTAALTVDPVADTPSITDATTNEDTQTTSGLVITRNAADGAEVTHYKITGIADGTLYQNDGVTQITNGSFITVAEGSAGLKFTPDADFNGTGNFTLQASTANSDTGLGGSTVDATININQINDTAVFSGDTTGSGDEDTVISGTLTASDSADGMTSPNYTVTTDGANGTASIDAAGNWSYTPAANYSGSDSFTVSVTDDDGNVETQVISITVNAVTDLTATDDSFSVDEDTTLNDTVATNDSTTSGGALSYAVNTDVSNGSLTLNNDGSFSYTPASNYHGSDSFTYTVTDADSGESATQTVSLTVNQVDDAGTFGGDVSATTNEDTATSGTVTFADANDGYTANNFALTSGAVNGTAAVDSNGNWSYTPAANYSGSDSFTVSVTDDDGNVESQVIALTVNPVGDLTAQDDSFSVDEDTTLNDTVASNDSTTSGGALSYAVNTDVSNGSLTLNNDGSFSYTPTANYHGSDSFTYTVTDADSGESSTQTVSLTVNPVDDAVTIGGDTSGSGAEDTVISGTLTASDSADGLTDGSYFTVSSDGTNGSASIDAATGLWSYTANADFNGSDSFTVTVTDDDGYTDTQVVSVTVTPVADIVDDSLTTNEETAITANVLTGTNGASADNFEGTPTLTAVTNGSNGSVSFLGDGTVTYTPDANFNGSDSFTYTITSGGVTETGTVNVTVNAVTDLTAQDDSFTLDEDTTLNDTVASNDSTTSGGALSYAVNTDVSNGSLTLNNDGSFSYTPTANYHGSDSFTYTVTDADSGESSTQTVSLTVNPVDDAVTIGGDTSGSGAEDTVISGTLTASDSADGLTDGSYFTVSSDGTNGSASIDAATGLWSYTASADFNGSDSFTVTVTDDDGYTDTQVVSVIVTPVADIVDDSLTTNEETAITANVLTGTNGASADNFEGTPTLTAVTNGSNGSVSFLGDGTVTYTPDANFNGSDSFTYTITSGGVTETGTVNVTVNAVTDLTAQDDSFSLNEDTTLNDTVASNDSTTSGGSLSYALASDVSNGSLTLNNDGSFSYTPAANYHGSDSFTYTVTDADSGESSTQTVSLTVNQVDDAGTFGGDVFATTNEDTATSGTVTFADATDGYTANNFALTSGAGNGTAAVDSNGNWSYTPNANYSGADSFVVQATDDDGNVETQVISITVNAVTDLTAQDDSFTLDEDTTLNDTVASNDSTTSGGSLSYALASDVSNGSLTLNNDGSFSYTPAANYHGSDSFTYTVTDANSGESSTQTVSLTVNQVDDAGTFGGDVSATTNEDTATSGTVTFADANDGYTANNFALTSGAGNGTAAVDSNGNWSYTPSANYSGADSFVVQATDDDGNVETQVISITVNAVTDLSATDDSFSVDEDTTLNDTVASNDSTTSGGSLSYAVNTDVSNGSLTLNNDGSFSYTPAANYHGSDSFTYTVTDADSGESSTQTVSLTVNPVDDAVTIGGDTSGSGAEDTVISGTLTASDSADGLTDGSYFTVSSDGTNGSASIDAATGLWSYTANGDFNGSDSFTVTVTDDDGYTDTQVVSVTVTPVADIVDDSLTTNEETAISANVLTGTNGASADNFEGTPTLTAVTNGSNGSVSFLGDGTVTYTPDANFNGSDSFTYTITSGGVTETGTVNVTVNAVTDLTAQDDSFSLNEDTTLNDTVASNDSTTSGGSLSYALASDVSNGSLTLNNDGSFSYTPAANYHGSDSFTYTVTDADSGESSTQTVSLTVNPVDDAVTIGGDTSGSGAEDTALSGTLTASDSADGLTDGSYFTVSSDGTNGSASIDAATGLWSYTANADFNGSDSFTVTVTDDDGYTDTQVVSVTVTPVADIVDDSLTTNEETAISANVLTGTNGASADNFEGTPTLTAVTNGSNGSVSFLGDGTVTYTPDANFTGSDAFTYTITSGGVTETGTVNVTVNAVTDLTAQDDSFSLNEDTTLNDTVASNDSTTSGGSLSYALASDVSNGSLTLNNDGSFSYTPAANYHGSDSFTYTVTDADSGESSTQTVSLTANQINDTAVFSGDTTGSGDEDTVISGTLTASDSADGMTSPNYTVTTDGANGTASIDAAGNWSYTPAANYSGSDSFTVSVTDDDGNVESQVIALTVNPVGDLTATDDSFTLDEDTTLNDTVASNDSTTSGGALSYAVNTDVSNGSLTLNNDGSFSYTPATNYHGSDSFTYTVTDADSGESSTQTVSLTVTQINDTAVFSGDTTGSGDEDTVISGALIASDSADGMTGPNYTVSTDGANGTASIDAAGNWSYTPAANYSGSDSFTISVTDDDGNVETQVISITVNAVTDLTAQDDSFTLDEDTTLNDTVATNDSTTSGGSLSYAVNTDVSNGSLTLNNDGSFSYTPASNYHGSDSFTYTVTDANSGESSTQTVSLTVNQVDDAGTFGGDVSATTNEDTATSGTVTFADATDGYTANNFALTSGAGNGTAAVDSNGNWSYTPNANYSGADSFVVQATDDDGNVESQVISITVNAVTDLTATDDSFSVDEDTTLNDTVATNDSTTSGGALSYAVNTDVSNGSLTLNNDGSFSYTPAANYHGSDSFTYTVTDANSGESSTQTVSLTVNQVDDAGTFGGDVFATTNEDTATSGTVTFADATDGYTANNFALTSGAGNGTAAVDSNGNWSYTPNANYSGADSFVVQATDDDGNVETQVISITVNAVTDLTAQDDSFTLDEDTTLNDTVATNDSTTSGGALSYALASDVSNGSLTLNNDGSFSYTPTANYHGSDSFTYTVTDANSGESSTQTVSLTVNQVDDAGTFGGDVSATTNEDTATSGTVTFADATDGYTANNFALTSGAGNGTAAVDSNGNWSYTPNANYSGADSFVVQATDDDGNVETQVISITVNAVTDLTAQDDSFTLDEDTTLNDTVASNDSTTSGGSLSYALASDVSNGSLTLNNDGSFSYTPTVNYHGSDSFTYTVTDADSGESSTQTVSLTVNQVNDTAVFSGDTTGSGDEDTVISGTLTASDSADGMTSPNYTVSTDGANGTASIDAAGNWSYTPAANWSGTDQFTVTVVDDEGGTHEQVVSITLVNKNVLPTGSVTNSATTGVVADGPLTPPSPQPEFEPVLKPAPAPEAGPESEPESESESDLEPETEPAVAAVTVGDERLAPIDDELLVQVLATESAVPERYQYGNDSHYAIPPKSIDLLNLGLAPFEPEKNEVGDLAWLMDNPSFAEGIGEMKRDLDDSVTATANQEKFKTEVLLGATAGLSVGVISWVLRTGSLIAGFMSIAPLWRQVDPIPILGEDAQEHQKNDALDEQEGAGSEVEQIFDEDSSR